MDTQKDKRETREELELTPDDLECLMAIARRNALQNYLVRAQGPRLEGLGLITILADWPSLTAEGWAAVDRATALLILGSDGAASLEKRVGS